MVAVLPRMAVAGLRAVARGGLIHTAALDTPTTTVLANQEDVTHYSRGGEVDALLVVVGSERAEQAAALGVKAQWEVKLKLGQPARPGLRAYVTGRTAGAAWWRYVQVTADLGVTKRLTRICTAVDVDLNR